MASELPRKVLHVLNSAGGGAALSTIGLMETMRAEGIEACAVCHGAGTPEERSRLQEAARGAVLFRPLYWWNRKIRADLWKRPLIEMWQGLQTGWALRSAVSVARFAQKHGSDLIHTNTILTPEGGMAARRLGLPHVWHLRELVGPGRPFRLRLEGRMLGHYLARHCSKVIANSHVSAAQVQAWLPPDLIEVVPNGIDMARFDTLTKPRRAGRVVVAMVGSLNSRSKNHGLFVEAASRVVTSQPVEFRIYGHVPDDDYVRDLKMRIAHHGLTGLFCLPGFVADPAAIMADIDVLVHPAADESFGRVVVEAMAAGLPVVGVRDGGVAELVEEGVTGWLAAPRDADGLAAHIARLVNDPALRQSMGEAGRRRACSYYTLEACANGVLRVYEAAMQRPLGAKALSLPAVQQPS